ncbi:synaptobrevin [Coprinopsis sp. MPI-PUGE-AT-0042]|nr:synaptobrevin [Coprinopsis sp. MPI-PUGE-AT-0042]
MNSLYTAGVRQTSSLQGDLDKLRSGDTSAALLGQISASLAAFNRTIEDYDAMTKREMIKAKQEKAQMRVSKFRTDHSELRAQFEKLKAEATAANAAAQRSELISVSGTPMSPSDARRRFQPTYPPPNSTSHLHPGLRSQHSETVAESPFRGPGSQNSFSARDAHALDEHTFIQNTSDRLDDFLAQGQEVLNNLVDQRQMLKGTQKRLLDAANTLGLSRNVIGWIEKRSTQDMYLFIFGAIFAFVCFGLIWYYLG